MNFNLFILPLFLLVFSFKSQAQKSFEGYIKFKTEIYTEGNEKEILKKDLNEKYGDSILLFYSKKGEMKRKYLNSAEMGNDIQLYDPNKGILYLKDNNSPEIDSLDVKINSISLITKKKISNQTILNLDCECLEYTALTEYGDKIVLNYCFSQKTPEIDPALFDKHNDFFISDYFKTSKRPYLKFSFHIIDGFKVVQTATKLGEKELNPKMFKLK